MNPDESLPADLRSLLSPALQTAAEPVALGRGKTLFAQGTRPAALQEDSRFAVRWIGMLNDEVRRLRAQTERLTLKGVEARLLHLIETEGQVGKLDVGSGLKSLSAQLGVTHEALYRTVAALEQQGRLTRRDGLLLLR